jgi:predicted Fe-Mo cluster-binding NifX family protein
MFEALRARIFRSLMERLLTRSLQVKGNFQIYSRYPLLPQATRRVIIRLEGKMNYAVPVSGSRLMSHFGQATEFMLLDVDQQGRVTRKETIKVAPHSCGTLPGELAKRGVGVVLAGGMGMGPRMAFQESNITVVLGVTELDPEKAVTAHANNTLKNGDNVCDHGDAICDHSH